MQWGLLGVARAHNLVIRNNGYSMVRYTVAISLVLATPSSYLHADDNPPTRSCILYCFIAGLAVRQSTKTSRHSHIKLTAVSLSV